jgi:hypothetical protein
LTSSGNEKSPSPRAKGDRRSREDTSEDVIRHSPGSRRFLSGGALICEPRRDSHTGWLEEIDHLPPETIARAGEGDAAALKTYDERRLSRVGRGSPDQWPSMGQDMAKVRRTEIEFLNGFVVREGAEVGILARANERLVDIVKRVERGELQQDPRHITELRLN